MLLPEYMNLGLQYPSGLTAECHGRISDGERYVGTVAGRIGYRAINV
jgi:hypothetical protein